MCSCLLWTTDVKAIESQYSQYDYAIIRPDRMELQPYFSL